MVHLQLIYPLKMVIFHSYVSLPEGKESLQIAKRKNGKSSALQDSLGPYCGTLLIPGPTWVIQSFEACSDSNDDRPAGGVETNRHTFGTLAHWHFAHTNMHGTCECAESHHYIYISLYLIVSHYISLYIIVQHYISLSIILYHYIYKYIYITTYHSIYHYTYNQFSLYYNNVYIYNNTSICMHILYVYMHVCIIYIYHYISPCITIYHCTSLYIIIYIYIYFTIHHYASLYITIYHYISLNLTNISVNITPSI